MKKLLFCLALVVSLMACHKKEARPIESEQLSLSETIYLTPDKTDSLVLAYEIEFPYNDNQDSALVIIQNAILNDLFGKDNLTIGASPIETAQNSMNVCAAMLKTEYKRNNLFAKTENIDELEFSPIFCEEQFLTARIVSLTEKMLSYEVERYVYMGGAHGSNTHYYSNYCLQSGKALEESDLFKDGYEKRLIQLLIDNLVAQNEDMQLVDDLLASDYMVGQIRPNGNFLLSPDGITYVFNQYEIAPYAYGETDIFISKDQLQSILRPDCKVFE